MENVLRMTVILPLLMIIQFATLLTIVILVSGTCAETSAHTRVTVAPVAILHLASMTYSTNAVCALGTSVPMMDMTSMEIFNTPTAQLVQHAKKVVQTILQLTLLMVALAVDTLTNMKRIVTTPGRANVEIYA